MRFYNFIDGQLVQPIGKQYIDVYNPANGDKYAEVPRSDEQDINNAVKAATAAFDKWSKTSVESRSRILFRIAELINEQKIQLAKAETTDSGKPIWLATDVEIPRAAANLQFFAAAIINTASEAHHNEGQQAINYTLRKPLGVVACISPWNLPLYLFTWKIAPALAVGNCVVAKPSEVTPYSAYLFSLICQEAGLPNGVLNIVHGYGHETAKHLVVHQQIKAVSFTGSTKVGKEIAQNAAPLFKKLSLELGGKNPNIIFSDCDFDKMIENTLRSSFSNQGQICLCGSRILVEKSCYEEFKQRFVEKTKLLSVGNPNDPNNQIGAIVSKQHCEKILQYIEIAKNEGGNILSGGKQLQINGECQNGWFIEPTIIEGLSQYTRTNQEEIFGPVVTIAPFDDLQHAVELANATEYGLAATIWTQNLNTAHQVAEQLQCGIVWINCWLLRDLRTPFGGVKNSGVGREGGNEAIRFFTEPKNVCIKL